MSYRRWCCDRREDIVWGRGAYRRGEGCVIYCLLLQFLLFVFLVVVRGFCPLLFWGICYRILVCRCLSRFRGERGGEGKGNGASHIPLVG